MERQVNSVETMNEDTRPEPRVAAPMYASTWMAFFMLLRENFMQKAGENDAQP